MDETRHLRLPYLAAAQAQKHVTHNEALDRIDAIVQLSVLDSNIATPPSTPAEGDRYIVATGATGAWNGKEGSIAAFVAGGWDFIDPSPGWVAFDETAGLVLIRVADSWESMGSRLGPLPRLGINTTADDANRLAVRSEAVLLSAIADEDGGSGDIRLVVSKEAESDTASLLFQNAFSGRAEVGLAGDDSLVIKVSDDGTTWIEAIRIETMGGAPEIRYDNAVSGLSSVTLAGAIDEIAASIRETLTADRTYYVRSDGSDDNDGRSDSSGGALLTLQRAVNVVAALDRSIYDVTIRIGAGAFAGCVVSGWGPGARPVKFAGAGPEDTIISGGSSNCFTVSGAACEIAALKMQTTSGGACAILATKYGAVTIGAVDFGPVSGSHIATEYSGSANINSAYTISGGGASHIFSMLNGVINSNWASVTLVDNPVFSATFARASFLGSILSSGMSFTGSASGSRYLADINGIIMTAGGGASYFPGNAAGSVGTGGLYV